MLRFYTGCLIFLLMSCNEIKENSEDPCGLPLLNKYASGFSIQPCGNDTVLFIFNPVNIEDTLLKIRIEKPINRFACLSTTHLPFFNLMGVSEKAVGVGFAEFLMDEHSKNRMNNGSLINITSAGALDFEKIMSLNPEVLLVYFYGGEDYSRYQQAGIQVIPINEYAEGHPLGRVEWLKVFGLLTGRYASAEQSFNQIDQDYKKLAQSISDTTYKPVVFTGSYYKGKWAAPGADSFIAQFIADAGAQYAFSEYSGNENINLDFETVLTIIGRADFFGKVLHAKEGVRKQDFLEEQSRFELLKTFNNNQLFYCNTADKDYFGRGILEPHLMLSDLIQIFHPEIASPFKPVYFHPLNSSVE